MSQLSQFTLIRKPSASNRASKSLALTLGTLAMVILIAFAASAWTEPGSAPPAGNVSAPLNASSTSQTKTGPLGVTSLFDSNNPSYFIDPSGDLLGNAAILNGNVDLSGKRIINLPNIPGSGTDAVNKNYVDAASGASLQGTLVLYSGEAVLYSTATDPAYRLIFPRWILAPFALPGTDSCSVQVTACTSSVYNAASGNVAEVNVDLYIDDVNVGSGLRCFSWSGTKAPGVHNTAAAGADPHGYGVSYLAVAYSCN